jgi:hypothetical protein
LAAQQTQARIYRQLPPIFNTISSESGQLLAYIGFTTRVVQFTLKQAEAANLISLYKALGGGWT